MSQGYQPGNRRFPGDLTFLAHTLNLRYQVPKALRSLGSWLASKGALLDLPWATLNPL